MEHAILSCYETIAAASSRMLGAARASDLDVLEQAESECAAMIAHLRRIGDGQTLSAAGTRRKMDIIRRVLANDAQIRELAQPWLKSIERLISGAAGQRRLHRAYG